eukprot:1492773-Pyramimonas_sp.AAC.1
MASKRGFTTSVVAHFLYQLSLCVVSYTVVPVARTPAYLPITLRADTILAWRGVFSFGALASASAGPAA